MQGWPSISSITRTLVRPCSRDRKQTCNNIVRELFLCSRCSGIDLRQLLPASSYSDLKPLSLELGSLENIVQDENCSFCQLLQDVLPHNAQRDVSVLNENSVEDEHYFLFSFQTQLLYLEAPRVWWKHLPSEPTQNMVSFAIMSNTLLDNAFAKKRNCALLESIRANGWISPSEYGLADTDQLIPLARGLDPQADLRFVQDVLRTCKTTHGSRCVSAPAVTARISGADTDLETWFIDCNDKLLFRTTDLRDVSYFALSYMWGDEQYEAPDYISGRTLQHHFRKTKLPTVVEDAIFITKSLGYKYLWVDRYCIPRLWHGYFEQKLAMMDIIYGQAECVIIAAAGTGAQCGLAGCSSRLRKPQRSAIIQGLKYTAISRDPALEVRDSLWNTRGWTYQESILGSRRLCFTDGGIYWQCRSRCCSEVLTRPITLLEEGLIPREEGYFRSILDGEDPVTATYSHIEVFCRRRLGRAEDRLGAIQGVMAAMCSLCPVMWSFYGLPTMQGFKDNWAGGSPSPTEQLLSALCWQMLPINDVPVGRLTVTLTDEEKQAGKDQSDQKLPIPSWSWAAWSGQFDQRSRSKWQGEIRETHKLDVSLENNPTEWSNEKAGEWPFNEPPHNYTRLGGTDLSWNQFKPLLHVTGSFVALQKTDEPATIRANNLAHQEMYTGAEYVAIRLHSGQVVSAFYFPTATTQQSCGKNSFGLILGRRQRYRIPSQEFWYLDRSPTISMERQRREAGELNMIVLLVLEETSPGVVERLGIAELPYWQEFGFLDPYQIISELRRVLLQ